MCGTSDIADRLLLVHEARLVADELLGQPVQAPLEKAINLGTARGFDRAVALLAARLRRAAGRADADAVRDAMQVLDVDWPRTTAAKRRKLIAEALVAAGRATALIPARIEAPLGDAADAVVAATRSQARRRQGLAIGARLNALDQRVIDHVVSSQGNFVRDEYGERIESFGEKARRIVAEGLEQGLGRDDIAVDLEQAARAALIERSPFYWEVVASSFIGQGRSFAQMSSYAEAGVERYVIHAILDEATTPICRYLDGKEFAVGDALERFDRVESMEDPEELKSVLPWVREQSDPETGRTLLYIERGGSRLPLAESTLTGFGRADDRGAYRSLATDEVLREAGVLFPPYHGFCRTTTLAVV